MTIDTAPPDTATDTLRAPQPAEPLTPTMRTAQRRRDERARWERPALFALLSSTAVLYLWGLGSSGWANSFYSAAAQAGSESWKAWFFGASDAASSITVDKPPLAIWVMGLSVRIFGLSSWSILVPEALTGVASVGLLYAVVRRATRSTAAGLVAGAVLALTPVATLMFRFNNPDALLVLLLIGAAGATMRAIETTWVRPDQARRLWSRATTWLAVAGLLLGLAFLTKMLQAFLVVPGLGLAYLLLAHSRWPARLRDLAVGLAAIVVGGGWWVAIVSLWPASDRPYIGGSQHNSILELIFGYNGFGRLDGNETGSVGGTGTSGGMWGSTGLTRMLNGEIGGQIGWLLPAAVVLLVAGAWYAFRGRNIGALSGLIVFGGWLLVTALTFSLMAGIFHPYYTVALAPAIGAIVGIAGLVLWRNRASYGAGAGLAAGVAVAAVTGFVLLDRTPTFVPWLRWAVLAAGLLAAALLAGVRHLPRRLALGAAALAMLAALAGPAAYSIDTARTAHSGAIPSAGPTVAGSFGPGGQGGPGGFGGPPGGSQRGTGTFPGTFPGTGTGTGTGGFPGGAPGGFPGGSTNGTNPFGAPGQRGAGSSNGGLLDGSTPSAALTRLLDANASDYTWVAATVGSNSAAGYQLATQHSVMPIGGFNGSDPSPTLAQFEAWVAEGRIHYFIASGGGMSGGPGGGGLSAGGSTAPAITSWIESHFTAKTVGGVTVYDLSAGASR